MLNRSKKLIFESKRCRSDRDKKNNPLGRTTVWRLGSLNELKDLWVKNVWGGDVISCWGSPMTEDDDIGSTPTLWSK